MTTRYTGAVGLGGHPLDLAVEGGRFHAPGSDGEAVVDLGASTVLPCFVESHCHIIPEGLYLSRLDLSGCRSPEDVLDLLAQAENQGEGWLHAVNYDQNKFKIPVHIERSVLDRVVSSRPVLLRHTNGHASVANSAALAAAGLLGDVPKLRGGEFVRDDSGELNGVCLESAHEWISAKAPRPKHGDMVEAVLAAGQAMVRDGITTATDMMTGYSDLLDEVSAYREAARRGCSVRIRLYAQWGRVFGSRGIGIQRLLELQAEDDDSCRICGVKLFADGAIGAATAAIYGSYQTTGKQGMLLYPRDELALRVLRAHEAGLKVAVHAIGDRAVDVVLDALEATGQPDKHRMEHALLLSDAQVSRIARSQVHLSMQPQFIAEFGDAYRAQLPELAPGINRVKSLLEAGARLSFSSDRPIVKGSPSKAVGTATRRPEGFDQNENIALEDAVRLYTSAGSDANGETLRLGSIEEGAAADFQVYPAGFSPGGQPTMVFRDGRRIV